MQSKLFPKYFLLQTAGSAIALATLFYSGTGVLKPQLTALGEYTDIHCSRHPRHCSTATPAQRGCSQIPAMPSKMCL